MDELLHLVVHPLHFFPHMEDNLHTRQIDTQFTCQSQDQLQLLQVSFPIKPGVSLGPGRLQESLTLVGPEASGG